MLLYFLLCGIISVRACNILSLSGGGSHGSFQAGVLNKLHNENKRWDIITGISAGSINGMMLGMFSPDNQNDGIQLLRDVWLNISSNDIYRWNWNPIYDQSLLDSSPLNKTINTVAKKHGGIAKRKILIGSVNLNTGILRIFDTKDFSSPSRSSQIIMASSAIPVVFPPVLLDGHYYVDGGTYSNELIRPAIKYCLNKGYTREEINIDVIICSSPIQQVTNKELYSDTIFGMFSRAYDVLSNAVSNHEIYTYCANDKHSYPMNIYKPPMPYPGGLLDFNNKDLAEMFKMGFNVKSPISSKYCF